MAFKTRISTSGLAEHIQRLVDQQKDVDAVVAEGLAEAAEILKTEMVKLAPVKTGNLRDHIRIAGPTKEGNVTYIEVGVIHSKKLTDATTARYANAQEYGTSSMAAQPYVRPGTSKAKNKARKALLKHLREAAE